MLDFKTAHYKKWLNNVPFGQYRRLGKKCTLEDFEEQSRIMSNRFKEKRYPRHLINCAKSRTGNLSQELCLLPRGESKKQESTTAADFQHNFITTYNHSNPTIANILKKHWPILMNDPHLKMRIPERPKITFRRAKTVKNTLAPIMDRFGQLQQREMYWIYKCNTLTPLTIK